MPFGGAYMQPRDIASLVDEKFKHTPGWNFLLLVKVIATSLSESLGDVKAWNDNLDAQGKILSRDVGLFEINIPASHIGTVEETKLYDPIYNTERALVLYTIRHFQPWAGYTSGWAMFPECWYWTQAEPHQWVKSGRFLHKALAGAANYYGTTLGALPVPTLMPRYSQMPKNPPSDGIGPRPVSNDGSK